MSTSSSSVGGADGDTAAGSAATKRWLQLQQETKTTNDNKKVSLSRVLGHTCPRGGGLAYDPRAGGELVYVCGSVAVRYDQRANVQKRFYVGRRGRQLTCITISEDGTWVAAGEKGKNAAVLLWDSQSGRRTGLLLGHSDTVSCVRFSPLKDYVAVVSEGAPVGADARSNLTLWRVSDQRAVWSHTFSESELTHHRSAAHSDDKEKQRDSAAPIAGVIAALDWSCDNSYFAIAGRRFLSYLYLRPTSVGQQQSGTSPYAQPQMTLDLHTAKLGVHDRVNFVSIACGTGSLAHCTFGLSTEGVLCAFTIKDRKKKGDVDTGESAAPPSSAGGVPAGYRWEIEKWVDLRMPGATHLSFVNGVLSMSGADAKIRVFEASKLEHIATLPKPPTTIGEAGKYPATTLCVLSPDALKVAAVYSDRTMVIWDARDPKKKPIRAWQSHSGCIWDIALLPNMPPPASQRRAFDDIDYDSDAEEAERASLEARRRFPDDSFVTCSADNSMRVWCIGNTASEAVTTKEQMWSGPHCLATIFVPPPPPAEQVSGGSQTNGLRCVKFVTSDFATASPQLAAYPHGLLASGDQQGNVRLHSIVDLKQVSVMEAHDREVRSIDFHQSPRVDGRPNVPANLPLLVSGSRDRMVHVHNLHTPKSPQSITPEEVHTGIVTQVRLAAVPSDDGKSADALLLISGGMDQKLSIRRVSPDSSTPLSVGSVDIDAVDSPPLVFARSNVVDLAVHPSRKFLTVLCSNLDKKSQATPTRASMSAKPVNCIVKLIDLVSCRESRHYAIQTLSGGDPIRMCLDPSGILIAIACSDKSVMLVDWYSGAVLTSFHAHAQVVTAMQFTHDCTRLLTVGSDGCIAVWNIDDEYVKAMQRRLQPATKKKADVKPTKTTTSKRSTAMDYLDDSDEEDETSDEEASRVEDAEEKQDAHTPAKIVPPAGLPPLTKVSDIQIGRQSSLDLKPKVLPTWARSTVVSPEALPGGSAVGASFPSGEGVPLSSEPAPVRGRWAQRVELDDQGMPQAVIAETNKVYGTLGTIGVGTILLDEADTHTDSTKNPSVDDSGAATEEDDELIEIEGDGDVDEEVEEDSEEFVRDNFRSAEGAPASAAVHDERNMMRSSITSQFLKKLRGDGRLNVPTAAVADGPASTASSTSSSTSSVGSAGVVASKQMMPSSFAEREAKTTTEVAQLRQQLRTMGILDGASQTNTPRTEVPAAIVVTAPASSPSEPAHSVSPNTSVVISSSTGHDNSATAPPPRPASSPNTALRPPALPTPGVHASLASLPSSAQSLSVHRETIESFHSSLQSLLLAFGQVKQAQMAASSAAIRLDQVPSVSVSFARPASNTDQASVAVIPVLPTNSQTGAMQVYGASTPAPHGSISFPSVSESALGPAAVEAGTTDLDALAGVYEQQLSLMQSVLSQLLPQPALPAPSQPAASSQAPMPLLLAGGGHESSTSSPPPSSTFLTQFPGSPTGAGGAAIDPLAQSLSYTQSHLLQSMEVGLSQQAHVYDRVSDRLAELVLKKLEAKVALGGTLSTTQQLALGMTLTPATTQQP